MCFTCNKGHQFTDWLRVLSHQTVMQKVYLSQTFWSQEDWPPLVAHPKPYYTPLRLDFSVKKVNISQTALLW